MKDILLIGSGLLAGLIVWFLKTVLSNQLKAKAKAVISPEGEVNDIEKFNAKKLFEGMGSLVRGDLWGKSLAQELSLRTWAVRLALIGIIIGVIYGYGWYQGHCGIRPVLDWHGKEEWVSLNDHYMHIKKDGSMEIVASDKKTILKKLTVKDFENLKKNSRPYGLRFKPFATVGGSVGELKTGFEAGLGVDFAKWYKYNANVFLTNLGAYLGVGYNLTENFDIMLGFGKGYKGDTRAGIFGKFKF